MRRALPLLACLAVLAACNREEPVSKAPDPAAAKQALAGAPPELAELHAQANQLLDGGPEAFRKRLADLRGRPVVVNKWASWCGPCRAEFPFFQELSVTRGKEVAFLGVNTTDNDADAAKFLASFPVSFPSYKDPTGTVSEVFKGVLAFPSTAFYDSRGELVTTKSGGYRTVQDLAADIDRYAR